MKRALIVSKTESGIKAISSLLSGEGFSDVACTVSADDAKLRLSSFGFDLVVINTPLDSEPGLEFALYCAKKTKAAVLLIVKQEKAMEAFGIVSSFGVLVIGKPLNKQLFHHYVSFAQGFRERFFSQNDEAEKLKTELEEMKVIGRAKLLLIQCLSMTEQQAHSYIEHQAMNMRKSKLDIAKQVIRTYQN